MERFQVWYRSQDLAMEERRCGQKLSVVLLRDTAEIAAQGMCDAWPSDVASADPLPITLKVSGFFFQLG